jgi:hypothetical protein
MSTVKHYFFSPFNYLVETNLFAQVCPKKLPVRTKLCKKNKRIDDQELGTSKNILEKISEPKILKAFSEDGKKIQDNSRSLRLLFIKLIIVPKSGFLS